MSQIPRRGSQPSGIPQASCACPGDEPSGRSSISRLRPPGAGTSRLQPPSAPRTISQTTSLRPPAARGAQFASTSAASRAPSAAGVSRMAPPSRPPPRPTSSTGAISRTRQAQPTPKVACGPPQPQPRPRVTCGPPPQPRPPPKPRVSCAPPPRPPPKPRVSCAPPPRPPPKPRVSCGPPPKPKPSKPSCRAPTLQETVRHKAVTKAMQNPNEKAKASGSKVSQVPQEFIDTPKGPQRVLQKSIIQNRVERTEDAEIVDKHMTIIDTNECSGKGKKIELDTQQIDTEFATDEGAPSETVTVTSTVSITQDYVQTTKHFLREREGEDEPEPDPVEISQLVEEENNEVENTLKIAPPDLTMTPEKYGLKKKLQKLRLNSESMALLEQSVIQPVLLADEVHEETPPEAISTIMHTMENGVTPQSPPNQIFNTLFAETKNEQFITMSSIAPGPLQDVVVPTEVTPNIHQEAVSQEVEKLSETLQNTFAPNEMPQPDIYTNVVAEDKRKPVKPKKKKPFKPIFKETPPWGDEDMEPMVNLIGAEPMQVISPAEVDEESGNLTEQLAAGIEYFVEADPIQYMSRVQLRGSQWPNWFPGYMVALPEFTDVVKIAKTPDHVLLSAWRAVQPKIFADDSIAGI